MKKIVSVVIDNLTCNKCLVLDGLDPDIVGYPPYHGNEKEDEVQCRCTVVTRNKK